MDLNDWDQPNPALIIEPVSQADWDQLLSRYTDASTNSMPLDRCVQVARSHGAKVVVVETRYVDIDYRSEFHALYGRMHSDVPGYAHRIHFFAGNVGTELWKLPIDHGYIGYVALRPVPAGLVSRAMLPPPADVAEVRCSVVEEVGFFGQSLTVLGVPFSQQDTSLGACAHTAAWVCHYTGHLRGDVARRPRADFALQADPSLAPHRALPSGGLTVQQLSDLLRRFDLPPIFYVMGSLPSPLLPWQPPDPMPPQPETPGGLWDTRVFAVLCRHLNGGYPVLVGTNDHAFVVLGWDRDPNDLTKIRFVRHDDQRGPYLPVDNPLQDSIKQIDGRVHDYGPWRTLQVPLPPRLWLAPENAERKAGELLVTVSPRLKPLVAQHLHSEVESLDELIANKNLALRTYSINSEHYKQSLPALGMAPNHVKGYRLARLPRHIWVVEAVDRRLRLAGRPSVLGEALVDSSSADIDPEIIAFRIHGAQVVQSPDRTTRGPFLDNPSPTTSGGKGSP
jgi:hypothetical protein